MQVLFSVHDQLVANDGRLVPWIHASCLLHSRNQDILSDVLHSLGEVFSNFDNGAFKIAAHFPHFVAITSTSEACYYGSRSTLTLFSKAVHPAKFEPAYLFSVNFDVVGEDNSYNTSAVFV